jgi:hypothetical protein
VACFEVLVARDTCKEGRCVVVHQGHLKAVVALLIGCAVLLLGVGCAVMRSQSPKEQGHTQATKKEQTHSPGATASEETTALEETTAFQAPEGTRPSSTARIACLRAEQGASSPPPQSTETLNGTSLTLVLTPKVAAHPDGVHIQMDNRLGKSAYYFTEPNNAAWNVPIPKGKSNQVAVLPPGTAKINCSLPGDLEYKYAYFEVVEGDSGYKSLDLECKPGATPSFAASADVGGYTGSHPVEQARENFSRNLKLKEGDVVEEAGYPQGPDPKPVRVVRNGKVVATIDYDPSGYYATYCDGQM